MLARLGVRGRAWVLIALGPSRKGVTLTFLIGSMDAFNHAVAEADDAARWLGRLIASGLVEVRGQRFVMTDRGRAIYRRRKKAMFEQATSILPLMDTTPCIDGAWTFGPGEYDAAYAKYWDRTSRPMWPFRRR